MRVNKIRINNLASFLGFENDSAFKKTNLLFGTNGAGKSTLGTLLSLMDDYKRKGGPENEERLKAFFHNSMSKESESDQILVEVCFEDGTESVMYNRASSLIRLSNTLWHPIRVFNEDYTDRTIGQSVRVDLQCGITIGESNIELEKAKDTAESLEEQMNSCMNRICEIVQENIDDFQHATGSGARVDSVIRVETALDPRCAYAENSLLLSQRQKLGYGRPPRGVEKIDSHQVKLRFDPKDVQTKCSETVKAPTAAEDVTAHLRNFTDFFKKGIEIYDAESNSRCPFCRRQWPDSAALVEQYKNYIQSVYSRKREEIGGIKKNLLGYREQVLQQVDAVERARKQATDEAPRYGVDMKSWRPLVYDQERHDALCRALDEKHNNMERAISVLADLSHLEASHLSCIEENNEIIKKIQTEVDSITARRKALNGALMEHFAAKAWSACQQQRQNIATIGEKLKVQRTRIAEIEESKPPQDTVRIVFNSLISLMGLAEYSIDDQRRLTISLGKEYDISNEGQRVSSAQRKCLSLCYFFAEVISEVRHFKDLKCYCLIFDDPVDSADYIYFYSIANVIENAEKVLSTILGNKQVRLGQLFVLTHNSLLHDRLAVRWAEYHKTLRKQESVTVLVTADRSINNYNEYIGEICRYYKNPGSQKRRMIYVGNLIRRVLEILASFDTLGSNDIQAILDGMGKPKLGLIANYLSHESFARVLNPLSSPEELRDACGELLKVIEQRHPVQYASIAEKYLLEEEDHS